MKMILLLTIFLCTFHQFAVTTAYAICEPESLSSTECVKITNCEEIVKHIKELHSSNSILHHRYMIGYMRNITCGFEGNVPKICCSLVNSNPRIIKRIALPEEDKDAHPGLSAGASYLLRDSSGIIFPDEPSLAELDLTTEADSSSTAKPDTDSRIKADTDSTTNTDTESTTNADSESTTEGNLETTTEADSDSITIPDSESTTNADSGSNESSESKEDLSALPTVCGNFIWSKNLNKDGYPADLGDFPWLALLEYNTTTGTQIRCGGALISNRYVLTAAHCVTPSLNLISVRLGEHDLNMDPDCMYDGPDESSRYCADKTVVVTVEKQIPHENYSFVQDPKDPHSKSHDIALVRLSKAVASDYVKPICLPGETPVMKGKFLSAGWGAAPNNAYLRSSIKRMSRLTGVEDEDCDEEYNKKLQDDVLCAKSKSLQTACTGDSGGPLIAIDVESRMTVEGLFSPINNDFCLMSGIPGTYTNVRKYTDWIKANM